MSYEFQPCLRCGGLMSVRAQDTWRNTDGKLYHYTLAIERTWRKRRLHFNALDTTKYIEFPTCLTCRETMHLLEKMDNVVNGGA